MRSREMCIRDRENEYPKYIKLSVIPVDNKNFIHKFFHMRAKISTERVLNTDGKTTFSDLSKELTLKSEKIVYSETEHRLKWLDVYKRQLYYLQNFFRSLDYIFKEY